MFGRPFPGQPVTGSAGDLDGHDTDGLRRALEAHALSRVIEAGATLLRAGDPCRYVPFVTEGRVRVHLLDEGGREVVLYRLRAGECCVLATLAVLGGTTYAAEAIAEIRTSLSLVPSAAFDAMVADSADLRAALFGAHSARFADMLRVVSSVTFAPIDARLARCLLDRADSNGVVAMTHASLAAENGSAREVVTRALVRFSAAAWVRTSTGAIRLLDPGAIASVAGRG